MNEVSLATQPVAEPPESHGHAIDVGSEGVGDDVNSHGYSRVSNNQHLACSTDPGTVYMISGVEIDTC
jgi:hypothetical protein